MQIRKKANSKGEKLSIYEKSERIDGSGDPI